MSRRAVFDPTARLALYTGVGQTIEVDGGRVPTRPVPDEGVDRRIGERSDRTYPAVSGVTPG